MSDSKIKIRNLLLITVILLSVFLRPVNAQNLPQTIGSGPSIPLAGTSNAKVQVLFFYSNTCSHCLTIIENIVKPLQTEYPTDLNFSLLELGERANYEALMAVETQLEASTEVRELPVVIIGERILVGEAENERDLRNLVEAGISGEGIPLPAIEGLDFSSLVSSSAQPTQEALEVCTTENGDACAISQPIYVAYFYQTGCKECARSETDLAYLKSKYPQMIVEEFNIFDSAALANWMAERVGRTDDLKTPSIFIGDYAWIGEGEIRPQTIEPILQSLDQGSPKFWADFNEDQASKSLMERFETLGPLAILLAGLVDGLNPCAFATIIFFVSYLSLSGKKGKEILLTGTSFTVGVFLAYLLVGFGFYKVLDLVKEYMSVLSKIVYALTALFCLVLAALSVRDYFKTRHGDLDDMALKLPEPLRKRINETVREGRKAKSYYLSAFVIGLVVSMLELACTGQIYLPVIISMSTMPELRGKASLYLVLYNLMFIVPLIIVFVLAYYGTTSKQFTGFLKKHAATVKIGMAIVFLILGVWLISSLLA